MMDWQKREPIVYGKCEEIIAVKKCCYLHFWEAW